ATPTRSPLSLHDALPIFQDLQLRPAGGAELPDQQRALLARRLSRRRAARGRGGVDALPRLLARRGGLGPERVRRSREPRGDRVPDRKSNTSELQSRENLV